MWIVFGTAVKAARVPGGLKVERLCDQCRETATFYEKEVTSTFRLYFMDVFDYQRHRVMACGCCGACYATDELGAREAPAREEPGRSRFDERIDRAAGVVGHYVDRAAGALEAGISSLLSDDRPPRPTSEPPGSAPDVTDDNLAELDPLEARFRELERKARERSR